MRLSAMFSLALLALAAGPVAAQALIHHTQPAPARAAAAAQAGPEAAQLKTLYSNLGPAGNLYQPGIGPAVSGGMSGEPLQYFAVPFTPALDASITGLTLPIALNAGNGRTLGVALYSDDAGKPGTMLYAWTGLTPFAWKTEAGKPFPCCSYLTATAEPGAAPVTADTPYWLVALSDPQATLSAVWLYNSTGAVGRGAYFNDSGTWSVPPATTLPALAIYGVKR